ncbi:MAG TPA: hypothetical protein VEP90_04475, partial [Methylomirabilota bacterium]|nr:hypothetical protein [Methylomirabilota bacterium]
MTILIVKNQNNRGSNKSLECTSRRIITTTISLSLSFVIAGILFLSSIENSNMTVHAQLSSYISNNSTFPN